MRASAASSSSSVSSRRVSISGFCRVVLMVSPFLMWDGRSGFVAEGGRPIRRSLPIFKTNVGAFTFPAAMVRQRVLVHGLFKGVVFRYTLARAGSSRGVVGFARNLSDGAVEAVFEG